MVRETKDKQIMELKKMVEDSSETQRNEYEKRVCFTNLWAWGSGGGGGDEEFDLDQAHLPPDVCVSVCVHVCMCECVDEYKHACVWKACGD